MIPNRFLRIASRLVRAAALCVAFAVPVYIFVRAHGSDMPGRVGPPSVSVAPVPLVPAYRDSVPVLIYHDISDRAGRFTVSRASFAQQMAALRAAGFNAISMKQLLAFFHGSGALPERPVLITFDDGLGSVWRAADPILEKYRLRAVSFVISGQIGQHGYYYLRPSELRAMVRSGRWDVEAHTHFAHVYVQTDREGHTGPALTNRQWLPAKGRIETEAEFRARVIRDLDLNIDELRAYVTSPLVFAYPFSAASSQTNDPRVIPMLTDIVARRFSASFVDNEGQRFINRYDGSESQQLPRIEVYRATTAASLITRLRDLVPVDPRVSGFPSDQQWISERKSAVDPAGMIDGGVLTLRPKPQHWLAVYWAPTRTELWRQYRVSVMLRGLGADGSGASETVILGSKRSPQYAVSLSAGNVTVSIVPLRGSQRVLRHATIRSASRHRLELSLAAGRLHVSVDRRAIADAEVSGATHGGIGFGAWRDRASSPVPSFSTLSVQPLG